MITVAQELCVRLGFTERFLAVAVVAGDQPIHDVVLA